MDALTSLLQVPLLQLAGAIIVLGVAKQKFGIDILGWIMNGKKNGNGSTDISWLREHYNDEITPLLKEIHDRQEKTDRETFEHRIREEEWQKAALKALEDLNKK